MNRHEERELAMVCLYQSLLLNRNIKEILMENEQVGKAISPFLYTITIDASKYLPYYKKKINAVLKDNWDFERLNYVEQAILVIAICELEFETASRQIVIDEAILLSKKYCDDASYKFINGVLDKL